MHSGNMYQLPNMVYRAWVRRDKWESLHTCITDLCLDANMITAGLSREALSTVMLSSIPYHW